MPRTVPWTSDSTSHVLLKLIAQLNERKAGYVVNTVYLKDHAFSAGVKRGGAKEEWDALPSYPCITAKDGVVYRKFDAVHLNMEDEEDLAIGLIIELRKPSNKHSHTMALISYYYKFEVDIPEEVVGFDLIPEGDQTHIISPHFQVVDIECFEGEPIARKHRAECLWEDYVYIPGRKSKPKEVVALSGNKSCLLRASLKGEGPQIDDSPGEQADDNEEPTVEVDATNTPVDKTAGDKRHENAGGGDHDASNGDVVGAEAHIGTVKGADGQFQSIFGPFL
ncbi:hypothetical protein CC78DRAFT_584777 [Lojkania enalia]|uniref:Uncharacterized protein n=1 Tax=Lojkania enalia TaxID=147567 RepID=A0A9P4K3A3_9PLEO|nr:hypothetical protein CC78DRAFT_584777 [Didymosphaeria enalia]